MATIAGQMGMTKAKKKQQRLASMGDSRKRDKANQRSSYHKEFKNAPGLPPPDLSLMGYAALNRPKKAKD